VEFRSGDPTNRIYLVVDRGPDGEKEGDRISIDVKDCPFIRLCISRRGPYPMRGHQNPK